MELEKVLGWLLAQDPSTSPQNNHPQATPTSNPSCGPSSPKAGQLESTVPPFKL